ncbi:CAP-Gly domain-containing linker protein 1-like [Tigriopus californicus]|uniref:CAP-Gly domain-containing linker protein 1-like n=1 Tax=Tigriopus californicus TaxID=6832 RepID=UPI0027D9F0D7|nr:CAP-Gly domain-containing linker protein 1-like [Tigriopus californicus]
MEDATQVLRLELEHALKAMAKITKELSHDQNGCILNQNGRHKHTLEVESDLTRLKGENQDLKNENQALKNQLQDQKEQKERNDQALEEIRGISARLQGEVLDMDREKIRLADLVKAAREENEVLSQVMEQVSKDYEELKRSLASKNRPQANPEEKVQALRNMSRAFESENELLLKDRDSMEVEVGSLRKQIRLDNECIETLKETNQTLKVELEAKDKEREFFLERFKRVEMEKINVMRQLANIEHELDASKEFTTNLEKEAENLRLIQTNSDEILAALREGKRVVEQKLQDVLSQNTGLNEQVSLSEIKAFSLEEAMSSIEREKLVAQSECRQLEQQIAEQTTLYESQIDSMQNELSLRLEELDENRDQELDKVKQRYIDLFDEKAEELHTVKEQLSKSTKELNEAKRLITDLEFREVELQDLLSKARSQMDDKYQATNEEVQREISSLKLYTIEVETELEHLKAQYEGLQSSYKQSVDALGSRLYEITDLLQAHKLNEDLELKCHADELARSADNQIELPPQQNKDSMPKIGSKGNKKKLKRKNKRNHTNVKPVRG